MNGQYSLVLLHAQSRPTLYDPMDYSPPGSSVCGIFQTRIPEWDATQGFPTSGDLPNPEPNLRLLHLQHWQADSLPLHHSVPTLYSLLNAVDGRARFGT